VAAFIARAVVGGWVWNAACHSDGPIIPPIPSSLIVALNVNECGTVYSFLFYQLFTHTPPPLSPSLLFWSQPPPPIIWLSRHILYGPLVIAR
jgi:hypothetical protein